MKTRNIKQHSDSITGYSVRVVERFKNTDLPRSNMFSELENLKHKIEDAITVSHYTSVLSEFVVEPHTSLQ